MYRNVGNKVQATVEYAVICGPAALTEIMVLMDRQEDFQFLIEKLSSVGEVVLDNTHSNVTREACDLDRRGEQHKRLNDEDDDDETEMEEDSILIPSHSTPDHPAGPYSFDEN